MYTLQKLNVIRIVDNETEKVRLISKGFKEVSSIESQDKKPGRPKINK